ncbi:MAG: D-alanyl-D-alanine carboxypeptidase, partial [Solirubrobacteraceae bacterium]|nr:D-alanyl-D-alanine carboxypeptidase [Solirubrobacteraceae bacterium]
MRRFALTPGRRLPFAVLVSISLLGAPPAASATSRAQVQKSLRSIVQSMPGNTSVYVRESATQTVLVSRAPTVKRIPASVTKMFTTSSALLLDGPDARLATQLRVDGEIDDDGVLRGDLIVRGSGDPALRLDQIQSLADAVDRAGITRLDGELRADLSGWTSQQGTPLTGGAYNREIGGRLGALVTLRGFASGTVTDPARQVLVRLREAMRARGLSGPVSFGASAPSGAGTRVIATVNSPTIAQLSAATNSPSDNFYAEMLLRGIGARHG